MEIQDIITGLDEIQANICPGKYETETSLILESAKEELLKFVPKHVVIENGYVKCTTCNNYIRYPIMDRYNNCPMCGQKIAWPGEEEEDNGEVQGI